LNGRLMAGSLPLSNHMREVQLAELRALRLIRERHLPYIVVEFIFLLVRTPPNSHGRTNETTRCVARRLSLVRREAAQRMEPERPANTTRRCCGTPMQSFRLPSTESAATAGASPPAWLPQAATHMLQRSTACGNAVQHDATQYNMLQRTQTANTAGELHRIDAAAST
jgi:hypothetical protein